MADPDRIDFADELAEEQADEQRVIQFIEDALADGDFYDATMAAVERQLFDHVPPLLYRLWQEGRITNEQLPDAVAEVWITNRAPVPSLGQRRWLELFKTAGAEIGGPIWRMVKVRVGTAWVDPAYPHLTEPPSEPVEIWRGAKIGSGCGMSWSVHRDCAIGFAQAWADLYDRPSGVYRAVVPPHGVLALFGDEREQEVVVNPRVVARGCVLVAKVTPSVESHQRHEAVRSAFAH